MRTLKLVSRLGATLLVVALALVFIVPIWWTLASALRPAA